MAIADFMAFYVSLIIVDGLRSGVWGQTPILWVFWPAAAAWMMLRLLVNLYPPFGLPQPEELRRSVLMTAIAGTIHLSMLVALGEYQLLRLVGLEVWIFVIPLCYFTRSLGKYLLIRKGLYGSPYVIVGDGGAVLHAIREMKADPELGMIPVAAFRNRSTMDIEGVPVLGPPQAASEHKFPWPVQHAIIAFSPDTDLARVERLVAALARVYSKIMILDDALHGGNMWARLHPLGPYLAIELQQTRFSAHQRRAKRLFDLCVGVPLLVLASPFIAIAALGVKLASPGPAFFTQSREGLRGQPVRIYKIRTMVPDAEKRLTSYLAANLAARFEWERTLKLRHDPRIIPGIGKLLRRASIDELPQLLNIVKGEMSLVGPRIMPTHEVTRYDVIGQELRRDVPPGLTGLWQVTARNNSDLKVRELADSFYVRNWSMWLDGWILLRTIRVVLAGSGAY